MRTQLLPSQKGGIAPNFRPMSTVAKRLDASTDTEVGLGPGDIVLDGTQFPLNGAHSTNFRPIVYCGQTVAHLSYC